MSKLQHDEADFVIVGTGAGGATASRVLTAAGYSVVMLEEGANLDTHTRPRPLLDALTQSMRDMGTQTTVGATLGLLQGRCVGGSTAINSGIIWRTPDDVREDWRARHGLHELVNDRHLERIFDRIENELGIAETPERLLGGNGALLARAAGALGLAGQRMLRNTPGCEGSGGCLQGCTRAGRQSMDVSYVPRSLKAGGRLHTHARVTRVMSRAGRAHGVLAERVHPQTGRVQGQLQVRARRAVILSAGALHTPVILRRSGIRRRVGEGFQAHPGASLVARFKERVGQGFGGTQVYEIPQRARGFKIESLSMPPETLTARLPGVGGTWQRRLAHLEHYAHWCTQVRMAARGSVRAGRGGRPVVRFQPLREDLRRLADGLSLIAELMFAAGAEEVYPGIAGVPEVITTPDQALAIRERPLRRRDVRLVASHLFGGACAGVDPARSVVGPSLESHALPGLFVMDASVCPSNLGVNPQHTIMALSWRAAEQLA